MNSSFLTLVEAWPKLPVARKASELAMMKVVEREF